MTPSRCEVRVTTARPLSEPERQQFERAIRPFMTEHGGELEFVVRYTPGYPSWAGPEQQLELEPVK